jgi:hypothetical protein
MVLQGRHTSKRQNPQPATDSGTGRGAARELDALRVPPASATFTPHRIPQTRSATNPHHNRAGHKLERPFPFQTDGPFVGTQRAWA